MKKFLTIVLTVLFVAGISAPIFAAEQHGKKMMTAAQYEIIRGEVVSVDAVAKTALIKEDKSGTQRTVKLNDKAATELKAGDKVKIKVKPGSDVAESVKVLKDKDMSKKK